MGTREKALYYVGLLHQLVDEEAMRKEKDIPTGAEGPGTNQFDSEDSSDAFTGPATEGDFVRLQRDFY